MLETMYSTPEIFNLVPIGTGFLALPRVDSGVLVQVSFFPFLTQVSLLAPVPLVTPAFEHFCPDLAAWAGALSGIARTAEAIIAKILTFRFVILSLCCPDI
jgi:hypothetical protein